MKKILRRGFWFKVLVLASVMLLWGCNYEGDENDGDVDEGDGDEEQSIVVNQPAANEEVDFPIELSGEAPSRWYFEAVFSADLVDDNGNVLATAMLQAEEDWMQEGMVDFSGKLERAQATANDDRSLRLIFKKDNPSGLPENDRSFEVPINLTDAKVVSVYFSKEPIGDDCSVVEPVSHFVANNDNSEEAALEDLLKGPLSQERGEGYVTSVNEDSKLKSLTIEEGVATVDFDATFNENVAGACTVGAIRAQIEKTLMQFESVNSVVITVDGESNNVLQP